MSAGGYHCNSSTGACYEFPAGTSSSTANAACAQLPATPQGGPCVHVGTVGYCSLTGGLKVWYYTSVSFAMRMAPASSSRVTTGDSYSNV